ncbi:Uncharacterised protein [Vibrio cholerae]|nr:Uncharacterised protein [Vibrio cholerae]CSB31712.1 Uncharacterised protein [Vibrio cholerae]CSC59988.1 Uncharacterised protein [Vibrio cholerae]
MFVLQQNSFWRLNAVAVWIMFALLNDAAFRYSVRLAHWLASATGDRWGYIP